MDRRGLKRKLIDLNDQFASWVREQHSQCREEAWLDGVTEYQRACQDLVDSCRQTNLAESSANALDKGPDFGIKAAPFQAFGKPSKPDPGSKGGFPNGGGFFNFSPASQPAAFQFGSTPLPIKTNGVSRIASDAPAETADGDEHAREEPSEPIPVDPSAEVLFSGQATLFMQTPSEGEAWTSRGKGKLTLRRPKDAAGKPCHLVFTTESGRVLVNASLYRGLRPRLQDKGRLLLSLFFSEEAGSDPTPQQRVVLIRLAEGKNKELADLVMQYAPQ